RETDYLALVVNAAGEACGKSRQRAEVGHDAVLPEEGMVESIPRQIGLTDYLTPIVNVESEVPGNASKVAEVDRRSVPPEHSMDISRAVAGLPDNFAVVVDCVRDPVLIAWQGREFLDLAVFPHRSLNLQDKDGTRVRVGSL